MPEFDVAIIGAGPAATAALLELEKSQQRIAVLAGSVASAFGRLSRLHPKIQSVSLESGLKPGVSEPLVFSGERKRMLFSTAAIGGLANYWGQQCLRWEQADPWPQSLFGSFSAYEAECGLIEELFSLRGGNTLDNSAVQELGFNARVPRLMTGTKVDPHLGLAAMRAANQELQRRALTTSYEARAISFSGINGWWRIVAEGDQELRAKRLVLAAGVIGNMRLLMRSFPHLVGARFRDHVPWMLYMVGLRQKLFPGRTAADLEHFNELTLEQVSDGRSNVFASVYNMRRAGLSLVMASLFGRSSRMLRGLPSPWCSGLIQPVQVWTPSTLGLVEVHTRCGVAEITSASSASLDPQADSDLAALMSILGHLGARLVWRAGTPAGFGFHYHALELCDADGLYTPVDQFLRGGTSGGVICVDASILPNISCRPPTLTAMACAKRLIRNEVIEVA